jgi:hypothetical protein
MYNPVHRLVHIVASITNSIKTVDVHTKMQIFTQLNAYSIDTINKTIKLEKKIDDLEYEIKIIKEKIDNIILRKK